MTIPVINTGSLALATPNAPPFINIVGGNLAQGSQIGLDNPASVAITGGTIGGVALSSMPPSQYSGRVIAFLGDSIANGSSASNSVYAFPRQVLAMAGTLRCSYINSIFAGVPGDTTGQMLARLPAILSQGATCVVILGGTNDAGQSLPLSTYAANMAAMILLCRKAGVPCIVGTTPPRGTSGATATLRQLIDSYGHWLRTVGLALGALVADTYASLVDTTSGDMLAAYDSGDTTHPNTLGHRKLAIAFTAKLLTMISQNGLVQSASAYNLVSNPLMVGAGTQPTGYFEQPGGTGSVPTYSIVADTSGFLEAGRWAQMAFNAVAGGARNLACGLSATGWAVGDTLALTGKVQIVDTGGNWENISDVLQTASVSSIVTNQAGVGIVGATREVTTGYLSGGNYNIGPFFVPFVVPAGTTSMNLWNPVTLPTGANISARFGAMGVVNLTTLGLAATLT